VNWGFDLGYICRSGIMSRKRSLLRTQLDDSSSDDEDCLILGTAAIVDTFANEKKHGGSVLGRRMIYRDRKGGHERMFQDYLAVNPTYGPELFRRRLVFFHSGLTCYLCLNITGVCKIYFFPGTGCLGSFSYT